MSFWVKALAVAGVLIAAMPPAHAESELSASLTLPIASVVDGASAISVEGASAAIMLPAALSEAGASLLVLSVTEGAKGSVYLLERAGDGARASIEIAGEIAGSVAIGVGSLIETSAVSAGTLLSVAGVVIALIPTEAGRALLHHEQLSH